MSLGAKRLSGALCVLVDPAWCAGRTVEAVAEAALRGGATMIELRDKTSPAGLLVVTGCRLAALCHDAGALLIINDRADVALACGADGVHLGQSDLPIEPARRLLGPDAVIGASAATPDLARAAMTAGANYLGTGPFAATSTKVTGRAPLGAEGLRLVCQAVDLPVLAIGGISAENAAQAVAAGAAGVAVLSAVTAAADPEAAARAIRDAVRAGFQAGR